MNTTNLRAAPPPDVTRLFLVRHGSTAANEQLPFVLQGCEIDGPLTETGLRQAAALARGLQDFEIHAIYSSPLLRARQTAGAIAEGRSLDVIPVHELRECSVGQWEGMAWEVIKSRQAAEYERFFADPVSTPHPGGESYGDVYRRAVPAIESILDRHRGQNVVIVAHNMLNRVYLAEHAGIDLKHARKLRQANCCINLLHYRDGKTELVSLNSVLHLDEISML
jgi:broad specificity phosphatase PhoE